MDSIYIRKVLSGDTEAFRYFVNTYKDFAFSLSYSILKNNYFAEEAVQEAFIKSFEKLASFRKDASFKTWFGRIVINESLRKVNKKNVLSVNDISEDIIKVVDDTVETLNKNEQKVLISEIFDLLQPNESIVLDLFYLKENTIKEIKEMTSWSESKIKMLLLRSRKSFYSKLSKILRNEMEDIL